jgi:hypothetical protein|tara:strand:+ start:113 stop:334 length:222 start_codon:yes stop_codon:yes gene_type:complete
MFNLSLSLIIKDRKVYSSNDIDIDASNNKEHFRVDSLLFGKNEKQAFIFPENLADLIEKTFTFIAVVFLTSLE